MANDFLFQERTWQIREERERSLIIYYSYDSTSVLHVVIPLITLKVINEGEKMSMQGYKHMTSIVFH